MSKVIVFGGTGSLGKKLIEYFATSSLMHVCSRDEAKHWSIKNELANDPIRKHNVRFHVCDVRDKQRVYDIIRDVQPDVVIVAAALKHVDTCELSPYESIATNLVGTQNVVESTESYVSSSGRLVKLLFVSTDKACAPVNVYGMCKSLSERIVTSKALKDTEWDNTCFRSMCVRYGNVLESRGSIIPLFKFQSMFSNEITVTDPEMTRFVMTLDDSVKLINRTLEDGGIGQTWIPLLRSMRIGDLAELFSEKYGKSIKLIGLRPGEKLHEDLVNESESVRTKLSKCGNYYIIGPITGPFSDKRFTYSSSQHVMSKQELKERLVSLNIFDASLDAFKGKQIEEIRST